MDQSQLVEVDQSVSRLGSSSYGAPRVGGRSKPWLWLRLAGGLVDLGLITWAFGGLGKRRAHRGASGLPLAMGAVAGITIVDVVMALRATKADKVERNDRGRAGRQDPSLAITIDRPADEVYAFIRNPDNLPRFLSNIQSVRVQSDDRIDLRVKSLTGRGASCVATVLSERPGHSLTWIASPVAGEPFRGGTVLLTKAPGERGTELRLSVDGSLGGGGIGKSILRMWTREKLRNDLRRMKQLLELGQLTKSDASVHPGMHPARPSQSSATLRAGAST